MSTQLSKTLINYWHLHGTRGAGVFILAQLHQLKNPTTVAELSLALGMTQSCINGHLRKLQDSGLVTQSSAIPARPNRLRVWSLNETALKHLFTES